MMCLSTGSDRGEGGESTSYNSAYGEALHERGAIFRLQVHKSVGISQFEVCKRVGKSVI